jgi:hypothetical protein
MTQERIVAAALKIGRNVVASMPPPARHHTIMHELFDLTGGNRLSAVSPDAQGFLTDTGRFVGREEAWQIARAAGHIKPKDYVTTGRLFSEDLW